MPDIDVVAELAKIREEMDKRIPAATVPVVEKPKRAKVELSDEQKKVLRERLVKAREAKAAKRLQKSAA